MFDAFKWLMTQDLPLKKAVSGLIGLLGVVVSYLLLRSTAMWGELAAITGGPLLALVIIFATVFLTVQIVWVLVHQQREKRLDVSRKVETLETEQFKEWEAKATMFDVLQSLTPFQINFLVQRLETGHPQVQNYEYEIGSYDAVWKPEIDVLINKRIVRQHGYGTYEVTPWYWDFLREHYDAETGHLTIDLPKGIEQRDQGAE